MHFCLHKRFSLFWSQRLKNFALLWSFNLPKFSVINSKYDFLFLPDSAIALSFFYSTFLPKKEKKSFCTIFQVAVNQLETLLNEMEKYFLAQKDIRGNLSNASLKRKDKKWFKSLLIKRCFCLKVANASWAKLRSYM